jgi:hypothetical protein
VSTKVVKVNADSSRKHNGTLVKGHAGNGSTLVRGFESLEGCRVHSQSIDTGICKNLASEANEITVNGAD